MGPNEFFACSLGVDATGLPECRVRAGVTPRLYVFYKVAPLTPDFPEFTKCNADEHYAVTHTVHPRCSELPP